MKYALSACEMKHYDQETINEIGIPALVLMERAAQETASVICQKIPDAQTALIIAGTGNNGGDGIAVGRILAQRGIDTTFILVGNEGKRSEETKKQIEIIENLGLHIQSKIELREYDIVVDSLFGIGLSREITGLFQELIADMNSLKRMGAMLCAVDIPSGISADNGKILGTAVKADLTVTFSYAKKGHLLYPGREYAGELFIRDIGIPKQIVDNKPPSAFYYEKSDISRLMPKRKPDGNKGTFGKVLLIAGSHDAGGACILCGMSILKTGAGMLKIITPECNRDTILKVFPEAMLYSFKKEPDLEQVEKSISWADVIVAGPGIGKDESAKLLLKTVLKTKTNLPMILDADALNLISENKQLDELAQEYDNLIMTPHPGELVRLLHTSMEKYQDNRVEVLNAVAKHYKCTVVGKDATTLVIMQNSKMMFINTQGNSAMATAGSGDVLAGIIGGLAAQGAGNDLAACLGVYIHGLAGMEAADKKGQYAVLASDLTEFLPMILR